MLQALYDLVIHFGPAFIIGIFHTIIPCEDKAIFFFWSLGIAKSPKRSALILVLYGLGLMFTNLLIAVIATLIIFTPNFFIPGFRLDPYLISFFGALSYTIAAIVLFFFITKSNYTQKIHTRYKDYITHLDWEKNRTPFLFGTIVGFAPCIFEFIIYSQAIILATTKGPLMGPLYVFYFGVGTFVGLIMISLIKQGTSRFIKPTTERKNTLFILMILIIIVSNIVIMYASIFRVNIFPESLF